MLSQVAAFKAEPPVIVSGVKLSYASVVFSKSGSVLKLSLSGASPALCRV
jgi:hypothetical protein